jgi:hypothetical protein
VSNSIVDPLRIESGRALRRVQENERHGGGSANVSASPVRRVAVEAMRWDCTSRIRAESATRSTASYLLGLELLAARDQTYDRFAAIEFEGAPGEFYGPDGLVRRPSLVRPLVRPGRHWMSVLIVRSDGWSLDWSAYVRRVMAGAQRDLGCTLEWAAANHLHCRQPHVHVVLHGERRPVGAEVVNAIRGQAAQIGPEGRGRLRTPSIASHEVFQPRFTRWDLHLAELAKDGRLAFESLGGDDNLWTRLEVLETMRLAEMAPVEARTWLFAKGWLELLVDWGEDDAAGDLTSDVTSIFAPDGERRNRTPKGPLSASPSRACARSLRAAQVATPWP